MHLLQPLSGQALRIADASTQQNEGRRVSLYRMWESVMTWNHRVIRQVCDDEVFFGIHEVFYDEGVPDMCTVDAVGVCGESLEGLEQTLEWMQKALGQPVLEMSDFEEGGKYRSRAGDAQSAGECRLLR